AHALPRRPGRADRQQLDREPDPADRDRALELAVRRIAAGRPARGGGDEPDPVGADQRPRSIRLPARRARAAAHAAKQPHRETVAAPLDAGHSDLTRIRTLIKRGCPAAYAPKTLL